MKSCLTHDGGDDTEWMVWCANMWFTRDILTMSYSGPTHENNQTTNRFITVTPNLTRRNLIQCELDL